MNNSKSTGKTSCNQLFICITQHLFRVHQIQRHSVLFLDAMHHHLKLSLLTYPLHHYMQISIHTFAPSKQTYFAPQHKLYDIVTHHLYVPNGKIVYMQKDNSPSTVGQKVRFLCNFDGPFLITGHSHNHQDLLNMRHVGADKDWQHPVNIEKVVVVPESTPSDISPLDTVEDGNEAVPNPKSSVVPPFAPNPDLAEVAFRLGQYLNLTLSKSSVTSQACKFLYESFPPSRGNLRQTLSIPWSHKVLSISVSQRCFAWWDLCLSLTSDMLSHLRR